MAGMIAGQLNPKNKDAIDWHPKGLIGYGCHTVLAIIDVASCRTIQTLCGHDKPINLVKFGLQEAFEDDPYGLKCVTSDAGGRIIIWSVLQGKKETSFYRPGDEVVQMQWFTQFGIHSDLLLTLHSSNSLVLWNTRNGDKNWVLNFSTKLFNFAIDPRNYSNLAFSATNSIILLRNVLPNDTPLLTDSNLQNIKFTSDSPDGNQAVQIVYHPAGEDLLFVLFQLKVLLIHTESRQILTTVNTENMFPLCNILPCNERDAFYLAHANGVISFWQSHVIHHPDQFNADLTYEQTASNDAQRFFSKHRVFGAILCPVSESSVALLFNSGKIVFYQLNHEDQMPITPYRIQAISDITPFGHENSEELCFAQAGLVSSLGSSATTVRIRPMDQVQNSQNQFSGKHLAALGSSTGTIQFIDLFSGKLEKEFNVHNSSVKCLEWVGCDMIVSASYSSSVSANGAVRNDVILTNALTGAKKRLRPEIDESPIHLIRVSYYQRYLALSFRNDPLEIWDLHSHRLLRRMSRKCPIIVDMAWSGKHHTKKPIDNSDSQLLRENLVVLDNENHLYHVIVKGLHVRDGKEVNTQWKSGTPPIRCMTWKDDILAFGDVNGYLRVWDLAKRTLNQVNSQSLSGPILRCVFSRLFGDATIAVQYSKGIVLFDALCLKPSPNMLVTESVLLDIDMFGVTPVCISAEGIFRFAATTTRNNSIPEPDVPELLKDSTVKKVFELADDPKKELNDNDSELLHYLKQKLLTEDDSIMRSIKGAKFNGNLPSLKLLQILDCVKSKRQLPPNLSLFWQPAAYRKMAKEVTKVLLGSIKTTEQLDFAVEKSVVLGKQEWAKYALLNSDLVMPSEIYRLNAFKGCLLNSEFTAEEPKCFIKMVATNLIAQNNISDGIVLLFLIEQGVDACRFLASNGRWLQSIQYAKMSKDKNDVEQLMIKWADIMNSDGSKVLKMLAAMIFTSLGQWQKASDLMLQKDDCFAKRFKYLSV